ncbi:MAG: DUF5685 family protein [Isosphaeraceae bacterium]
MFGLLNPSVRGVQDDAYRRVYCRCCQHQNQNYGRLSLLFHSYEAVFLYSFCIDAGMLTTDSLPAQRCCKFRRGRLLHGDDAEVGRFCSSVSLLLASIKLEDNIRDIGSTKFRLLHRMLRSKFEKAFTYLSSLDKDFRATTRSFIEEHMAFEAAGDEVPIRDYCRPTARAFSYVFGLMAGLPGLHPRRPLLESVGELIGSAIIAFDCAVDWIRDQRTNDFNPLKTRADVQDSAEYSRDCLIQAGQLCRSLPGDDLLTVKILHSTSERIEWLGDKLASTDYARGRIHTIARPAILYSNCGSSDECGDSRVYKGRVVENPCTGNKTIFVEKQRCPCTDCDC